MNKEKLLRKFNLAKLSVKKHSPEILVIGGIVGGIVSTVLACKSTSKLPAVLDKAKEDIDLIKESSSSEKFKEKNGYEEDDFQKALTVTYAKTGLEIAKLYAPAVGVGVLSITSILAGHNILRKRHVALVAAYQVVDKSFKDYRSRVVDRFGSELDRELRYNIKTKEVEETVIDSKGKEKTEKKTIEVIDPNDISEFAKFFDESNPNWTKDPEYNSTFIRRQQDYANHVLKTKGFLFLNDVYDMLGMDRTQAGNIVGWIYDELNSDIDNFVDFGIYKDDPANRRFINGYERSILLDFNVDGPILDLVY